MAPRKQHLALRKGFSWRGLAVIALIACVTPLSHAADAAALTSHTTSTYGAGQSFCDSWGGLSYDGLEIGSVYPCANPNTADKWGESQCADFSNRYESVNFGKTAPVDGADIVRDLNSQGIPIESTGTGNIPQPGDVLSMWGGPGSESAGHTGVVYSVNVNSSGTGTIVYLDQNGDLTNGISTGKDTITVKGWSFSTGWSSPYNYQNFDWTLQGVPGGPTAASQMVAGALSRYAGPSGHISTTGPAPSGYTYESTFGSLLTTSEPGTVEFYLCLTGTDYFTSPASNCEGQSVVRSEGWAYASPPSGVPTVAIYRCRVTSTGTHFDSPDPNCEGQTADAGLLGYLVATALPIGKGAPTTPAISNLPKSGTTGDHFTAVVSTTGDGITSVTSTTTSVCTASGLVVSFVGVGTCSLIAHVAAGTNYTSADGSAQTFTVSRASQSALTITTLSGHVGTALTLSTSGGSGTGAVTFIVSNGTARGCTVLGSSMSAKSAGTCIVTATKAADTTYLATSSRATAISLSANAQSANAQSANLVTITVTFAAKSSALGPAAKKSLATLAKKLVSGASVTFTGYARGNAGLAQSRARNVASYLSSKVSIHVTLNKVTTLTVNKVTVKTTKQ